MGIIGVKVWIDLGDYSNEETADGSNAKAVKHRKSQRGRIRGKATRGNTVVFGEWALQSLMQGTLPVRRLRRAVCGDSVCAVKVESLSEFSLRSQLLRGRWKLEWVRVKASRSMVAVVKPGTVLFELGGVPLDTARSCFNRAHKLPVRVRLVGRRPEI